MGGLQPHWRLAKFVKSAFRSHLGCEASKNGEKGSGFYQIRIPELQGSKEQKLEAQTGTKAPRLNGIKTWTTCVLNTGLLQNKRWGPRPGDALPQLSPAALCGDVWRVNPDHRLK